MRCFERGEIYCVVFLSLATVVISHHLIFEDHRTLHYKLSSPGAYLVPLIRLCLLPALGARPQFTEHVHLVLSGTCAPGHSHLVRARFDLYDP